MDRYVNKVVNRLVKSTTFNSVNYQNDQVLPPWTDALNIRPNLLEYDEWILEWNKDDFAEFTKTGNAEDVWLNGKEYFLRYCDGFMGKVYGVPEDLRRGISEQYRKVLREKLNEHHNIYNI
jgi:hypothetical protein